MYYVQIFCFLHLLFVIVVLTYFLNIYTSTIRHSFSTLESIQRSPVVIASFSLHAMKLVFSSQSKIILDANFMACMRVGSSSKFFDSSIPIHAKEA